MKTFVFWYSEKDVYKAWIDAESLEEAKKQLDEVFHGDGALSLGDLTNFSAVGKDYDFDYSPETLEEVS